MVEKKTTEEFDFDATHSTLSPQVLHEDSVKESVDPNATFSEEDVNATQMSIDVDSLSFDNTRTDISVQLDALDENLAANDLDEKTEDQKPHFLERSLFSGLKKVFQKKTQKVSKGHPKSILVNPELPISLWKCSAQESLPFRLAFYGLRFLFLLGFVFAQWLLIKQLKDGFAQVHPARFLFLVVFVLQLGVTAWGVVRKKSPVWLFVLPFSALVLLFCYGALVYHLADPLFFNLSGQPASAWLHVFFIVVFVSFLLVICLGLVASRFTKILFSTLISLIILSSLWSLFQGVIFELSFFQSQFWTLLPFYLRPSYLVSHVAFFVFAAYFLMVFLTRSGMTFEGRQAKSFAGGFLVLSLVMGVFGLTILQSNRVFHVLNFFLPMDLRAGSVELQVFNQELKLETKSFAQSQGQDLSARYRFILEPTQTKGIYLLQSIDQFGFPVRYLKKSDIIVYSNGKETKKFDFSEHFDDSQIKRHLPKNLNLSFAQRGIYLLKVDLQDRPPLLSWSDLPSPATSSDKIIFKIEDLDKAKRFVVKLGDISLLDQQIVQAEIKLNLAYFNEGNHRIQIFLFDELDQQIFTKELNLKIKETPRFSILSPAEGDTVDDQLSVLLLTADLQPHHINKIEFLVGEQLLLQTNDFLPFYNLAINFLEEGQYQLLIKIHTENGVLEKKVSFKKRAQGPRLQIVSPNLGSFAVHDLNVTYAFVNKKPSQQVAGIKVFVNHQTIDDIVVENNSFVLPLSRWLQSELYIVVQASFENGERVSDWVQINKGQGELELVFDKKTLGFLHNNKVALVLDASVSGYDNWLGSSKWKTLQDVLALPEVESKIEQLNPSFIVFGDQSPHYLENCQDARVLVPHNKYDKTEIGRLLKTIKPRGVSALADAYQKALTGDPSKILIFTDNTDFCEPNLKAFLQKESLVPTDVFVLGDVQKSDRDFLKSFAEATQGKLFQPVNPEAFAKALQMQLVLMYQILSDDKVILEEPFANKSFKLVSGKYHIKINGLDGDSLIPFEVKNAYKTQLLISGDEKQKKIFVKEEIKKQ